MFDTDHSSFNKMLLHCKGFEDKITKGYLASFSTVKDEVTACLYSTDFLILMLIRFILAVIPPMLIGL
ncbi:hypothetical protein M1771_07645 [Spiroplasma citri]|uniref:Transmembrane protein n=1 Tax=Spiroplasma citri TaxID=2133 RepID=A0AAX3SXN7_SPICI|nr:hypothetical protein [Spiroplasma citri]WFG95978.1 hypothetical protein M0C40_07695 [Spiroplasma citri]WFG99865.1 hypothetical protein M1771_07645 [Spiroplasma citri]